MNKFIEPQRPRDYMGPVIWINPFFVAFIRDDSSPDSPLPILTESVFLIPAQFHSPLAPCEDVVKLTIGVLNGASATPTGFLYVNPSSVVSLGRHEDSGLLSEIRLFVLGKSTLSELPAFTVLGDPEKIAGELHFDYPKKPGKTT